VESRGIGEVLICQINIHQLASAFRIRLKTVDCCSCPKFVKQVRGIVVLVVDDDNAQPFVLAINEQIKSAAFGCLQLQYTEERVT